MRLRTIGLISTLVLGLVAAPLTAEAQQGTKVYRIGYLSTRHGSRLESRPYPKAFRQGLRELGYIEGQNIVIEWRFAKGERKRLPGLANELVKLKVDCIFSATVAATRAAKNVTRTIPIVMGSGGDPVRHGFVVSLVRPGGNITGLTSITSALAGKRLEFLKEAIPNISRVAVLWDPSRGGSEVNFKQTENAARALGVKLESLEVERPYDLEEAIRVAVNRRAEGLIVMGRGIGGRRRRAQLAELAAKHRLPAMYSTKRFVNDGGLMSYAADGPDLYRRAAAYVDKILKGANPGDLPVERPTKFELHINLKAAKQIGITIPATVLYQATKVIK